MPTTQIGRLLTARQTAQRLQLSEGTLANWRSQHKGPRYYKLRTRVRYREADVEAFAAVALVSVARAPDGTLDGHLQ